jgi:ribose transport system ATP-binding protein
MAEAIISTNKLTKKYGGLTAVNEMDLDIISNEISAVVGGNGAGKSTLIKMISGSSMPTSGKIYYKNKPLPLGNPLAVRHLGIETIYQDLSLLELFDVADNIFLGREKYRAAFGLKILDKKYMYNESEKIARQLKIDLPFFDRPVRTFSGGQRQAVSILRAIYWKARVIIMDEPTAALGIKEKRQILDLLLDLKTNGVTTIIISHEMQDVFEIADRIIVIHQGRCIAIKEKVHTSPEEIANLIITGKSNE